jgi:hypothetical protein
VQLGRQRGQVLEHSGLVQHAASPADARRHQRVALYQVDAFGGVGGGGVGYGLLTGQDETVGVPAQHADPGEAPQELERLRGTGAEQDQVAEDPPLVHLVACRVVKHRAQRHVVPVDVGDDAQLHGA